MDEKRAEFYSRSSNNRLIIKNSNVTNLVGLPTKLPKIKYLEIKSRNIHNIPVSMNFRSFKGLPDKLELLENIRIYDSSIPNLESLTSEMPLLNFMSFCNCHFHNLKGIPKTKEYISFNDCIIDSFEGLDISNLNILNKSSQHAFFINTIFSSLHGINRTTLHSILMEYFSRFGNLYAPANFTPKGIEILNDCVNHEVNNANNPLEFVRRNLHRVYPEEYFQRVVLNEDVKRNGVDYFIDILNENGIEYPGFQIWDDTKSQEGMVDWIYALGLEDQLFIPEKIDCLFTFFEKSPTELVLQYRLDPNSLPEDQIARLIHEAGIQTLKILEDDKHSNLQSNDLVIAEILRKFTIWIKNGKILL